MDALKVAKIRKRMCQSYSTCEGCPFAELIECSLECTLGVQNAIPETDKETIAIFENWAKEHPTKTRQDEFLKLFPNAKLDSNGVIRICPEFASGNFECNNADTCEKCRNDYWLKEIE